MLLEFGDMSKVWLHYVDTKASRNYLNQGQDLSLAKGHSKLNQ